MFLILSSAYIDQALKAEFGLLPPTMLPLGNRRLFQHQIAAIPEGICTYISLPESYILTIHDTELLQHQNINFIKIPDNISLGAALVTALNIIDQPLSQSLHVLFGDTLILTLPDGEDIAAISEVEDSYNWAAVTDNEVNWLETNESISLSNSKNVVCGYFKFSQPKKLIKAITQSHWDFIEGLNYYHRDVGLTSVRISNWLDFGHVNTYYRSKAKFTTQRAFNNLTITANYIEKSSCKEEKIKAEAYWFTTVPETIRCFLPQYLGVIESNGKFCYRLEYLYYSALNELFVFSCLPTMAWKRIISSCLDFIDICLQFSAPESASAPLLNELFCEKTKYRLNEFCQTNQFSISQEWNYNDSFTISLQDLLEKSTQHLPRANLQQTIMHGDFCFSNILYDFRTGRIKTIDPRGLTPRGILTIYGDVRYDLAKLSHSVLGMYDWIIADYYAVEIIGNCIYFNIAGIEEHLSTHEIFIDMIENRYGITANNLYAMQIQLFLSMLPLHADSAKRQAALMANAFRLYQKLVGSA